MACIQKVSSSVTLLHVMAVYETYIINIHTVTVKHIDTRSLRIISPGYAVPLSISTITWTQQRSVKECVLLGLSHTIINTSVITVTRRRPSCISRQFTSLMTNSYLFSIHFYKQYNINNKGFISLCLDSTTTLSSALFSISQHEYFLQMQFIFIYIYIYIYMLCYQ